MFVCVTEKLSPLRGFLNSRQHRKDQITSQGRLKGEQRGENVASGRGFLFVTTGTLPRSVTMEMATERRSYSDEGQLYFLVIILTADGAIIGFWVRSQRRQ